MLQMKYERRVHHMASGLLSLAGAAASFDRLADACRSAPQAPDAAARNVRQNS
jgi:hypothetical protein